MTVRVAPLTDGDVGAAAEFLQAHMDGGVTARSWRGAFARSDPARPNNGFQLLDGTEIVGVYVAYYSLRDVRGVRQRFCNLGAWCVLPTHRAHGLRLLRALLAQQGYHFLDLSPSGSVVGINERLGFRHLDTTTALVPTLPYPWRRARVSGEPLDLDRTLTGADRELYRHHVDAEAVRHVLLRDAGRWCWVAFRMDRRKGSPPVFASLLHASAPELLAAMWRPLSGHLLLRHRAFAILAELRVVGTRPPGSVLLTRPRPRMFHSTTLHPSDFDYLYSELAWLAW